MRTCIIHVTAHQAVIAQLIEKFSLAQLDCEEPVECLPGTDPVTSAIWDHCDLQGAWGILVDLAATNATPFYGDHTAAYAGDGVVSGVFAAAGGVFRHVESCGYGGGPAVVINRKTLEPDPVGIEAAREYREAGRIAESQLYVTKTIFS